jgi:hypothetical protein
MGKRVRSPIDHRTFWRAVAPSPSRRESVADAERLSHMIWRPAVSRAASLGGSTGHQPKAFAPDRRVPAIRPGRSIDLAVPGPRAPRNLPQGAELGFSLGMRVLHSNARAELHVLAHGGAKRLVVGHPGRIERGHIQLDETLALGLGDLQTSMNVDQVLKTELTREAVRATEALGREHRHVIDVLRLALAEQRLQQRIAQNTVVEQLLQTMEALLAASMLKQRRHARMLARGARSTNRERALGTADRARLTPCCVATSTLAHQRHIGFGSEIVDHRRSISDDQTWLSGERPRALNAGASTS